MLFELVVSKITFHTSGIPTLGYQVDKLPLSSTILRCSENEKRDCRFPKQLCIRQTPQKTDWLDIQYRDP